MNPTTSSQFPSYQSNNGGCFDLTFSDRGESQYTGSHSCCADSAPASTSIYAEGVPQVLCEHPISIPHWLPYYAAGPPATQYTNQQLFYDHVSVSSSGSSMPPTPPDLVSNSDSFAAGPPACSYQYQYEQDQDYSNLSVNKGISDNNNNNNNNILQNTIRAKNHGESLTGHITKHRKARRSSDKHKEKKKCSNCGSTKTPTWRRGPITKALLCNACGLYEKVSKKRRVVILVDGGKTKIARGALISPKYEQEQEIGDITRMCSECHTINAKRWYEKRHQNYYRRTSNNNDDDNNNNNNEKAKFYLICDRCIRTTASKL